MSTKVITPQMGKEEQLKRGSGNTGKDITATIRALFPHNDERMRPQPSLGRVFAIMPHFLFAWVPLVNLLLFTSLPLFFFSIFVLGQAYSEQNIGRGTIAAVIMAGMALYGMTFLAAGATARIGNERAQGWMRQMALTPLTPRDYNLARVLGAVGLSSLVGVVLYIYGFAAGVQMEWSATWQSFLLLMLTMVMGALMGLLCGLLVPSDAAQGLVGGGSSLLAFVGGIFVPLDQMSTFFQELAPYTPLWGAHQLIIQSIRGWDGFPTKPVLNLAVWMLIFAISCLLLIRRTTRR